MTHQDIPDSHLSLKTQEAPPALTITGHRDGFDFTIKTNSAIDPTLTPPSDFPASLDVGIAIETDELQIPATGHVWKRTPDGTVRSKYGIENKNVTTSADDSIFELNNLPFKCYLKPTADTVTIIRNDGSLVLRFSDSTELILGVRPLKGEPLTTIQTTTAPEDLMTALSLLGTGMKSWAPRRTFPTQRNHPPTLRLSDTTDFPSELSPPETNIQLTIPPKRAWVYPTASLAFWLGATLKPGAPALHLDGTTYELGTASGYSARSDRVAFEHHLRDILTYTFYFEASARQYYDITVNFQRELEASDVPVQPHQVTELPLADRLNYYLDRASLQALPDQIGRPTWSLTADIDPSPARAAALPFLARELAIIRSCPNPTKATPPDDSAIRSKLTREHSNDAEFSTTPTNWSATAIDSLPNTYVLPPAHSQRQTWIGDGIAVNAATATTDSYRRRLSRMQEATSTVDVQVVITDERMTDEETVSDFYSQNNQFFNYSTTYTKEVTAEELQTYFSADTDLLHYVGHITEDGFVCSDQTIGVAELNEVNTDMFILNGCSSYHQGYQLTNRGAIAGVATLNKIENTTATAFGKRIATLLGLGYPLSSAISVTRQLLPRTDRYITLGDSGAALTKTNCNSPESVTVTRTDGDMYELAIESYPSVPYGVGAVKFFHLDRPDSNAIVPDGQGVWTLTRDELADWLDRKPSTSFVIADTEFLWCNEATVSDIDAALSP